MSHFSVLLADTSLMRRYERFGHTDFFLIFSCAQNLSLQGKAQDIFNNHKQKDDRSPSEASEQVFT